MQMKDSRSAFLLAIKEEVVNQSKGRLWTTIAHRIRICNSTFQQIKFILDSLKAARSKGHVLVNRGGGEVNSHRNFISFPLKNTHYKKRAAANLGQGNCASAVLKVNQSES